MDFIERFFGISPDGGDGTAEVMIVVILVAVVAAAIAVYLRRRI